MAIATLEAIIAKVRKLTSSPNTNQLKDGAIVDYLNSFYIYDFPAQFRSLDLKDVYTFNTIKGIDTYPFDKDHWVNVQGPAYIAKREIRLFSNPDEFYNFNFSSNSQWQNEETLTTSSSGTITNITQANPAVVTSTLHGLSTGNLVTISDVSGMTEINDETSPITVIDADSFSLDDIDSTAFTAYTSGGTWITNAFLATVGTVPFLRSINNNPMATTNTANTSVFPLGFPVSFPNSNINRIQNILITANISNGTTLHVTDNGNGGLIGDIGTGANTISYETGNVNVAFSEPIPSNENIKILYRPVTLEMPLAIVFFQNQFTLSPVPDKGYTVEIVGYRLPSQALLGTANSTSLTLSGRPEDQEWWELLAVGTAKKVYEDRLDMDGVQMMDKMLMEKYSLAETRTYANLGKNRIETIYSNQSIGDYGNSPFGFGNF
jgi:hypothetical protein